VAQGHSLLAHDAKANYPEGYVPARYRAAGAETLTGLAYRAVHFVSDIDGRPFARRLLIVLASLCVFTAYGVASRMWGSREAGVLAAFVVALEPTLVAATNGREFSHVIFAAFFASLYATVVLDALQRGSRVRIVLAALLALLLLWVAEPARYGLAAWAVGVALTGRVPRRMRVWFTLTHAVVIVAGTLIIPSLAALHAAGSWTTAAALSAALVAVLPETRRAGWRAPLFLVAGTGLLTLFATPLRAGASEQFPALAYVFTRLRYLGGRPDASLLSDWMRHLWSADHAPVTPRQAIQFLIPITLLAVALVTNPAARSNRFRFAIGIILLVIASTVALVDQSAMAFAALPAIIMVSGAAMKFSWRRWTQSVCVALAAYCVFASAVLAESAADVTYQAARAAGVTEPDPSRFVWISFENTDRELVRFVSTRTSVSESILAPDDLSALLLAFSGRTIVQLPGTTSRAGALRHVELTRALYRDEASLYELCHRDRISYVIYSIDVLLDSSSYSPRYLARTSAFDPTSVAVHMQFDPASLRHFTLVYENDHYRVFKVTDTTQPVFLTDHPLFFQGELFARDGHDLEHFRNHVVWLMVTYSNSLAARARGNAEEARQMLDTCIRQAPRFTRARLALADTYMDLGQLRAAQQQITAVMEYAPDNTDALYAAAFIQVQMGNSDAARPYLGLLSQSGNREMVEKGRALQYYIDHNLPVKSGAPE